MPHVTVSACPGPELSDCTGGDRRGRSAWPRLVVQRADMASPCRSEVLCPGGRKPCSTAPRHRGVAVGSVVEVALPPRSRDGGSLRRREPSGAAQSGSPRASHGYLVDPASSHMLVSKTKPCMSKYERFVL